MTTAALAPALANPYQTEQDIAAALTRAELLELVVRIERASVRQPLYLLPGDAPLSSHSRRQAEAGALAGAFTWYLRKRLGSR